MKNFTGKLMLSNLESKQSFLLDYKDGNISESQKKMQFPIKKLQSVPGSIAYYETHCTYKWVNCTYMTYNVSCGGTVVIEYSRDCQYPQYCQQAIWIQTDSDYQQICEQVWFPDPPTNPENPGESGESFDPENPGDKYEFENTRTDSIKLKDVLECFDNVPTDANTTYSVRICADVPDNANTTYFITNQGKLVMHF